MPPPRKSRVDDPSDRIPNPESDTDALPVGVGTFDVALPGGGHLRMNTADEVVMWNETKDRYIKDYRLTKQNDLILLGALLANILMMYRAQRDLSDVKKMNAAQERISKAAEEIRKAEKALGIDKATREKGGQHTVADYITTLKRAAYMKGVHLSKRLKAYEYVCMGARWRIRLYRNGDAEDRAYHKVSTPEEIVTWLEQELLKLEQADKKYAHEKHAVFVGKL